MGLAVLFVALAHLTLARALATEGRAVVLSGDILAAVARTAGDTGPLGAVDDPGSLTGASPAAALFVNATAGRGWARRFGFSGAGTSPEAVAAAAAAVYVAVQTAAAPGVVKYDAVTGARVFNVSVGSAGDAIALLSAHAREKNAGCARTALVAVARLAAGSALLARRERGTAAVALLTMDACTGALLGFPVLLSADAPPAAGVRTAEDALALVLARDGAAAYVATRRVRVADGLANSNAIVYKVDLAARIAAAFAVMPRNDARGVQVAVGEGVLYVAIDRHPALVGDPEGDDAVEVFRRHPDDLGPLAWGRKTTRSSVDMPFTARLPRRGGEAFTKVVAMEAMRDGVLALLLQTNETIATWDNVKDTKPAPAILPAIRWLSWASPRWTLWAHDGYASHEPIPTPESTPYEDAGFLNGRTQRQAEGATVVSHPILLLVGADATIANRIDDLFNKSISSSVLPQNAPPGAKEALSASDMAVDVAHSLAYLVGTVRPPGQAPRLWLSSISLNGSLLSKPTSTPPSRGRACLGLSSRTADGRLLVSVARHEDRVRLQRHPVGWMKCIRAFLSGRECEKRVEMLCYAWVLGDESRRLCATANHIVMFDGKMIYMEDFCSTPHSKRCTRQREVPWNFKGACGEHIDVAQGVAVTQHVGEWDMTAETAALTECGLRTRSRMAWTLRSL